MVQVKQQLVPEAFQHAFTAGGALPSASSPPHHGTTAAVAAPSERAGSGRRGYLPADGLVSVAAGPPAPAPAPAPAHRPREDAYLDELLPAAGGRAARRRAQRVGDAVAVPAPGTIGGLLMAAGGEAGRVLVEGLAGAAGPSASGGPASPVAAGGEQQAEGDEEAAAVQVGQPQQQREEQEERRGGAGAARLQVYPYCIGPRDVFDALWELDLLQQVRWWAVRMRCKGRSPQRRSCCRQGALLRGDAAAEGKNDAVFLSRAVSHACRRCQCRPALVGHCPGNTWPLRLFRRALSGCDRACAGACLQVAFTDDLERADLVLHRRARPKEKQFAYLRVGGWGPERSTLGLLVWRECNRAQGTSALKPSARCTPAPCPCSCGRGRGSAASPLLRSRTAAPRSWQPRCCR